MSKTVERLKALHDKYYKELQTEAEHLEKLTATVLQLQAELIDKLEAELHECKKELVKAKEETTDTPICDDLSSTKTTEED